MNKTSRTETRRIFLLRNLPEPLTRASRHLQIFDNYIENTRLRLRSVRVPETKEWTWTLQQITANLNSATREIAEIRLNETEHAVFEIFEGREISRNERVETNEIRKNRYFSEFDDRKIEVDLFLGALWGLITAQIYFETVEESETFKPAPFFVSEISADDFYTGENLLGKTFADIQNRFGERLKIKS